MGERYVAPILRRFAIQFPRLSITIELTNRVVDLTAEDFDLAIRTGSISDPRLVAVSVGSRNVRTCAAPDYLSSQGRPLVVEDLVAHECIVGTAPTWHFTVGEQEHLHRPAGRFRCNSGHAVIEACIAGIGICQLPDFYILPFLEKGMVELVLDDVRPADEPIWAVYPRRRHQLPKVQRAVEALQHELSAALGLTG